MRRGKPKKYDLPVAVLLAVAAVLLYLWLPTLYPGAGFWALLALFGLMLGVAGGLLIRQFNARRKLTSEHDQSQPRVWVREWLLIPGVLIALAVAGPWWYGVLAGLAFILALRLLMWRFWPLRASDRLDYEELG